MKIIKSNIAESFERLTPFVRRTPVIDVEVPGIDVPVVLKLELLQHSGSFKARGSFANLLGAQVPDQDRPEVHSP